MKQLVPKFHPSLWSDADIGALTANEILAFIWGWTNNQITQCGFCEYSLSRFTFETKLDFQVVVSMCQKLPRTVRHFPERRILYYRKFVRHQYGSGESLVKNNVFKSILAVYNGITHDPLQLAILNDYPEIAHAKRTEVIKVPEKEAGEIVIEEGARRSQLNLVAQRERARAMNEDSVMMYALSQGLPATDGEWFWAKCEGSGWMNNGKPIKDWRQTLRAWAINGYMPSKKKPTMKSDLNGEEPQLPLI